MFENFLTLETTLQNRHIQGLGLQTQAAKNILALHIKSSLKNF